MGNQHQDEERRRAMSDSNPVTGQPYGGRNDPDPDAPLPGEREVSGDESAVGSPAGRGSGGETGSRAAESGEMSSDGEGLQPTTGIPNRVEPPGPADATEGDPPGGSAANQH